MATPTLYIPFDDTTAEIPGGTVTLTLRGTTSFGVDGIDLDPDGDVSAGPAIDFLSPAQGAFAIRGRTPPGTPTVPTILDIASEYGVGTAIKLRQNAPNLFNVFFWTGSSVAEMGTENFAADTDFVIYVDWDGTSIGMTDALGAYVTGTRPAPGVDWNGKPLALGSLYVYPAHFWGSTIREAIFFEAPLTPTERATILGTDPWTLHIVTDNDPPVVDAGADAMAEVSVPWTQAGSFTDADYVSTSWTATVDYDDGAGPVPLTLTGTTFDLAHTWTTTGTKTVTVSVEDDGGQVGTDTVTVTVGLEIRPGSFAVSSATGTHPTAPRISLA